MKERIRREKYEKMLGKKVGEKVRIEDKDIIIEVEREIKKYGEEVKLGGGKVIREGMGKRKI